MSKATNSYLLNTEQQKAVDPLNGIFLVCAGAGSGKTRIITARIVNLINTYNVHPRSILALTFTNKAANEMKERVNSTLIQQETIPFIGTFHSYCLNLLKKNSHLLPYDKFSIIDADDQNKLIKKIIQKNNLTKKVSPSQAAAFISSIKNNNETIGARPVQSNSSARQIPWSYDNILAEIFNIYENEKRASNCLDFDDLLTHTLDLFEKNKQFRESHQKFVRHILVDEYQDTNNVQHALLKALSLKERRAPQLAEKQEFAIDSLCVVGDEDQSIYSWRGAVVTNIVDFAKDFPNVMPLKVEQNYRSVQPILSVANDLIKNNHLRHPKTLWSTRKANNRILHLACNSGYHEADMIALFLQQSTKINKLSDHAILYRSHYQSREIEEALIRNSIPYKIIGGIQFYERLEIKDLLAYLRLIVNPFDRIALSRIINTPSRGLGDKFEELFYQTWNKQPFLDFKAIAKELINKKEITKTKADNLQEFIDIFDSLDVNTKPTVALKQIIEKTAYYEYLQKSFEKEEAQFKKENVKELINALNYLEGVHSAAAGSDPASPDANNTNFSLEKFLEQVALLQDSIRSRHENNDCVYLMTFHAAKGLEFDTIIISGLEEGILPSSHSFDSPASLEEERRLLYVGITRAKERLLLTNAQYRYIYSKLNDQQPSRFLTELPEEFIEEQKCAFLTRESLQIYFKNWLNQSNHVDKIGKSSFKGLAPQQTHTQ